MRRPIIAFVLVVALALAAALLATDHDGRDTSRPLRTFAAPHGRDGLPFDLTGLRQHQDQVLLVNVTRLLGEHDQQVAEAAERARRNAATRTYNGGSGGSGFPGPCIIGHESAEAGTYSAENPISTASGAYQILDTTWSGYGGFTHAADAPAAVQDQRARDLWNNGRGGGNWHGTHCPGTG